MIFDLLCLVCVAILLWQLARLELGTWQSDDVAPTILGTPLWIPRLTMPLGMAVLLFTLLRTVIGDWRRLAALHRGNVTRSARAA